MISGKQQCVLAGNRGKIVAEVREILTLARYEVHGLLCHVPQWFRRTS